jgi:hypothetical protein
MGMQLPHELVEILSLLGFTWPEGDETKLLGLGQTWTGLSGQLDGHVETANTAAAAVWTGNKSETVDAFQAKWTGDASPAHRLTQGATGADIIGAGVMVCAGIVLALKVNVIVQATLTIIAIAEAIAAAFVTFGASAALVVVLREACKRVLDWLLGEAIGKVLGG